MKTKNKSGKDPRPIANTDICYVCSKKVDRANQEYWEAAPSDRYPDGVIRHEDCAPGSDTWKKSDRVKKSPLASYLNKKKKSHSPVKDITEQAIKEFTGRVKYMVYMDSTPKPVSPQWILAVMIGPYEFRAEGHQTTGVNITINDHVIPFKDKKTLNERIMNYLISIKNT